MTIKKYFSYSPFDGFNFYDILENAKESAEAMLIESRKNAVENGEWDDEDAYIFWGEVNQAPFEIKGEQVNDYGDCETEFELRDVVAKAI